MKNDKWKVGKHVGGYKISQYLCTSPDGCVDSYCVYKEGIEGEEYLLRICNPESPVYLYRKEQPEGGMLEQKLGGALTGDEVEEMGEEFYRRYIPDHVVVVTACDCQEKKMTIYDPNTTRLDNYNLNQFLDAWADSKNFLITINQNTMCAYNPHPIEVNDVELHESLNELREAIAENAHEIWGLERKNQGWTYGPKRDDDKKQNPCMVPYAKLPENEKVFDRDMAMNTLKLIKKLGYDIVKQQDTELYDMLLRRLRNVDEEDKFYCPHCREKDNKLTPIYKRQVFCDVCGHKIDIDWNLYD